MKKSIWIVITLCVLLLSTVSSCAELLTMDIETYDFVPGELALGAGKMFKLVIQNNTGTTIMLAIAGDSFYYDSPCWKITVNGPLDPKCVIPPDMILRLSHNPTELKVLPGTNKYRCPPGAKVGEPGTYSISIEYDGTTAPEGCYRGKLRTPVKTYTVKPLLGADEELYALWKKQNPEKSICFFPVGMKPDPLKPFVFIQAFPKSTLAGWALGDTWPGARFEIDNGRVLVSALLLPVQERDVFKGNHIPDENGKEVFMLPEETATLYTKAAEQFLAAHPDHVNAGLIYSRLSLAYMVLHRWQDAYQAGEKSLNLPWQEWPYYMYPPRVGIEKAILREAMQDMVRRGFAKENAK